MAVRAKPLAQAPLCPPDANRTTLPPHTSVYVGRLIASRRALPHGVYIVFKPPAGAQDTLCRREGSRAASTKRC